MRICPECGKEVQEVILPSSPPKLQNQCFSCGWKGEERKTDVIGLLNGDGKFIAT